LSDNLIPFLLSSLQLCRSEQQRVVIDVSFLEELDICIQLLEQQVALLGLQVDGNLIAQEVEVFQSDFAGDDLVGVFSGNSAVR